jgi:hypothetical protein
MSERPERLYQSFPEFMERNSIRFDGTFFYIIVNGLITGPLTISRNPQLNYWSQLQDMFAVATKFDPTIEFSIQFCIHYHQETKMRYGCENNGIFPKKVFEIFPIPWNVRRFFQILPVKLLRDEFEKRRLEIESSTSKLQRLTTQSEETVASAKANFLSNFERLYLDETIKVLTSADFPECLKRIVAASEPCDDAWKVFRHFDFIWHTQMPILFGLMMTRMVKTSLSKSRPLKPTHLLSFHELFGKLPKDMQKLYVQPRFWIINHSILLILSSKLTNNCFVRKYSWTIQIRFLAKLAEKLTRGLEFKKLHRLSISI